MKASALARAFQSIIAASSSAALAACGGKASADSPNVDASVEADAGKDAAADAPSDAGRGYDVGPPLGDAGFDAGDASCVTDAPESCCNNPCAPPCGNESPSSPTSPCCQGNVVPLEAGAIDAPAGLGSGFAPWDGGWVIDYSVVAGRGGEFACGAWGCTSGTCRPFQDAGAWLLQCSVSCTGRRPQGMAGSGPKPGTPVAVYLAEMARLEAASVHAFRHLKRELVAHGAPRALVRAAERAARDEIRHARMAAALTRRYGSAPAPQEMKALPIRSLEAMAIENAVEGCVRETLGALIATWQAACAKDPVIRSALTRIARDETRHAALAFRIDGWVKGRLDAGAIARVEHARRLAWRNLIERSGDTTWDADGRLGLPTRRQFRALAEHLSRLAA